MATSCMLPGVMACRASFSDVKKSHDTALRDAAFSLASRCQPLNMPPPVAPSSLLSPSSSSSPRASPLIRGKYSSQDDCFRKSPSLAVCAPAKASQISPTTEGLCLPHLNVSSKDLRYRGEGAEHIVLRVLNSGQVLRLRKTVVGSVNLAEDLVLRASKDEEFLRNVARPILGPLLTDESLLVKIDPVIIQELKNTTEAKRDAHRCHREINKAGIACICPDAASIFIPRYDLPISSSSPAHLDTSTLSRRASLAASSLLEGSFHSQCIPLEENRNRVDNHPIHSESIMNSPIHSENIVISPNLSLETRYKLSVTPFLPLADDPLAEQRLVPILMESRTFFKPTEMNGIVSCNKGTSRCVSTHLPSALVKPSNICIEIKPKQGFIDTSTPDFPLCRYCVKQYIKIGKKSKQDTTSKYCPLDLFSGEVLRMQKAVDGLLESPQNNLKIFMDGDPVEDYQSYRYLRDVIIAALTYDFSMPKACLPTNGLSPLSPLGRTLTFQMLDQLGVHQAANHYCELVKLTGSAKAVNDLLQNIEYWTDANEFCQLSRKLCSRCILDCNNCQDNGNYDCTMKNHEKPICHGNILVNDESLHSQNINVKSSSSPMIDLKSDVSKKPTKQEDMVRILQNYLIATTAKDLSLMILLSGPHRSTPTPINVPNSSPFIIELESGVWYRCQVTGVDLVAKPPSKILKHEQDYMKLKAVLEELKKQEKEPICCNVVHNT
ncbi:hypothetical protein SK128_012777 [Halocaridina rubra]|uniref:inositol-pentakisphosphate 2-kinase n=1 Tax=Halocaridina rubra TaxID=373956 RepID=A0AAN9A177_HALRR